MDTVESKDFTYDYVYNQYTMAAVLAVLGLFVGQCSAGSDLSMALYQFISILGMPFLMVLNGEHCRKIVHDKKRTQNSIGYLLFLYILVKIFIGIVEFCLNGKVTFALFSDDNPSWYFLAVSLYLFLVYCFRDSKKGWLLTVSLILALGCGCVLWLEMFPVILKMLMYAPFFCLGYRADMDKISRNGGIWTKLTGSLLLLLVLFGMIVCFRNHLEVNFIIGDSVYEKGYFFRGCVTLALLYGLSLLLIIAIIAVVPEKKVAKRVYNIEKRLDSFYFWYCILTYLMIQFPLFGAVEMCIGHKMGRILWLICGVFLVWILSRAGLEAVLNIMFCGVEKVRSLLFQECWKRRDLYFLYTISFFAVFLIAWSPFLQMGRTFIWSDGVTQHFPLLVNFRNVIREGVTNLLHGKFEFPFFEIYAGLGDDSIGLLGSSGATDPLHLLLVLFPLQYAEYLYTFLAIFRLYLAGLSFLFLCRYFKKREAYACIGSMVYCFCGYAIFCAMRHPYFVNPMILLPLLVVGLDKILKGQNPYLFIVAVSYSAFCGFYHLYMMTIMLGCYGLLQAVDLGILRSPVSFLKIIWRAVYGYILGIGVASIVFIPAIVEFLNAWRSGSFNYQGQYSWRELQNLFFHFISPAGSWDQMAFAAIVLLALILLFGSSSKDHRVLKLLVFLALAVYMNRIGGLVMNGFQYSSNRWTFGLVLIMSYAVVEMLPELLHMTTRQKWISLCVLCLYSCVFFSTSNTRRNNYAFIGVLYLAITLCIAWLNPEGSFGGDNSGWKRYRIALCHVLIIVNVGINGMYLFLPDQGNYISQFRRQFGCEMSRIADSVEQQANSILGGQPDGRIDSTQLVVNTSYVVRVPTMLIYSSTANGNVLQFWREIEHGSCAAPFNMTSTEMRTITGTLLSEKYQIEPETHISYVPYGYIQTGTTDKGNLIFENSYALPWGYTYENVISYEDLKGLNGVQKQQAMLQAVAIDGESAVDGGKKIKFCEQKLPYTFLCENCQWEDGVLKVSKENASITLDFSMCGNSEGYIRLQDFDINGSGKSNFTFKVMSGDIVRTSSARSSIDSWYFGRKNYLLNLGFSKDKRTSCTIVFPVKGTFRLNDIELYALPMDGYPEQVEALRKEPLKNIQMATNRISGTVDCSKDRYLCMSIPYSKGWKASVDGKRTEILRGNYMFMVLPLTEGHHEIEFTYCSPGLKIGALFSAFSLCILTSLLLYDKRRKRKY